MKAFARTCQFVSGSDLAASTVPGGTNIASGASFPGLSEPPQRTQTLGKHFVLLNLSDLFFVLVAQGLQHDVLHMQSCMLLEILAQQQSGFVTAAEGLQQHAV